MKQLSKKLSHNMSVLTDIIRLACYLMKAADALLLKETQLTYAQFKMLLILDREGNISQKSVAERLDLTQAAVSRLTEHLLKKKYLSCETMPINRRQNSLNVTPEGQRQVSQAWKVLSAAETELFEGFPLIANKELKLHLENLLIHCEKKLPLLKTRQVTKTRI